VFALTPFDRDGVASDYAVVPAAVLAPKPRTLTHRESAALTLAGLAAWQGLFEHGALRDGERVRVLGAHGGVGHLAVQLAGDALAGPDERADLVFDTVGGDALAAAVGSAPRVVSRAEEVEGVTYFIVEPSRGQLIELARRADAGELKPAIDSVFPLEEARAAFARLSERGKSGKVVLVPSSSSGGRTDRASRVIAAAPERVFPALVDPEALTAWLPPDGMRGRFERFDARPGGPYRLVLTYADASAAPGKSTADS
jgi:NADPH:quinone reductase-like Zn-dependent oxidoreductase